MSSFNEECLKAHNEYREKHGAPPLVLSEKICQYSQNWAQTLANRDSGRYGSWNLAHSNCFANGYGENCAGALKDHSGRKPVELFYKEISVHNFSNNAFYYPSGHFTQVVWKSSKQLGVGRAVARSGNVYVVCNYAPPGNVQGQFRTNVFPLGTRPPAQPTPAPAKPPQPEPPKQEPPKPEPPKPREEESSQSSSSSDIDHLKTKPMVRESFLDADPAEIVEAIFSGKLGLCMGDRMERGYHLETNHYLMSKNQQYVAILQEDGNFVLYNRDKGGVADFATDTYKQPVNLVQLRNDGSVVLVNKSDLENNLWTSFNNSDGDDCFLIMRNDGKLLGFKGTSENDEPYFEASARDSTTEDK